MSTTMDLNAEQPSTSNVTSKQDANTDKGTRGKNGNKPSRWAVWGQAFLDAVFQDSIDGRGKEIKWNIFLGVAVFLGFLALFFFAFHPPTRWQSPAILFLLAGGALAAGILVGFLFGIPRARQQAGAQSD